MLQTNPLPGRVLPKPVPEGLRSVSKPACWGTSRRLLGTRYEGFVVPAVERD